jgi:glycerophosphoryl diester phosphodiesterase
MKYIAHRGLSSQAPENTIPAFELAAAEQRYFGIETDVQTTKDGQFVIFHDDDLKRMNGITKDLKDLTYLEASSYPIISGSNIKKHETLRIPLLTDYLDICSYHNKTAVIEIKRVHDITQLSDFINILDNYASLSYIIISFNINYLKYLRALTSADLQLLADEIDDETIYDCRVNHLDFSLSKDFISPKWVNRLKTEGFKIAVWTVNDPKEALKLESLGIDYLTTDKL